MPKKKRSVKLRRLPARSQIYISAKEAKRFAKGEISPEILNFANAATSSKAGELTRRKYSRKPS